ncbi:DUF3768 domain-containing protein [uncultured Tateyamaria sp.]|uniref:DUF3768 domain-containing protein n=1 Tax=uncultured Tateyamaria sp. TaxID=455651 RepID=UPI00261B2E9D|nr:DUF3768 domain-containing protein [uncultured Tateyamaria sp.]
MNPSTSIAPECPDPAVIAAQNDAFRRFACLGETPTEPIQGRMVMTQSLCAAGDGFVTEAVQAVGTFDTFEPENDPAGWHDFGSVTIRGESVFWKLDLYEADSDFRFGAEAPDNLATTIRVLTIMMARDW